MDFQEFPKSLYMSGDTAAETVVVFNSEQEDAKRSEGFLMASEKDDEAEKGDELADLRQALTAAGIEFDKRWGIKRLQELLPKE